MEEYKKVTVNSVKTEPTNKAAESELVRYSKVKRVIYYILGICEFFMAFRLVLKLLGANTGSWFVSFIYTLSGILIAPFNAIFSTVTNPGLETTSYLEPATVVAMIVYAIVTWGIAKLVEISKDKKTI